jgi:uncharacterized Tic20 family protein
MDPRESYSGDIGAPVSTQDERTWGALAHGGAALGWLASAGLLSLAIPLLILIVRGPTSAFVADHARECLNFQITAFILVVVFGLLSLVLIGIPFLLATVALALVWTVIAATRAVDGQLYRYPFCIRFIR